MVIATHATEVYIVDVEWWIGEDKVKLTVAVDKVFVVAVSLFYFAA
jgi:hypothetical protein